LLANASRRRGRARTWTWTDVLIGSTNGGGEQRDVINGGFEHATTRWIMAVLRIATRRNKRAAHLAVSMTYGQAKSWRHDNNDVNDAR